MNRISIHLTDTCNNSCRFCVVDSHKGNPEKVDRKVVNEFLETNAGKGYEWVNLHGGEPTIVPELLSVLDKIQELGYPNISIQTNGRILKDIDFARKVVSKGVNLFVISLHGKDAKMHDYYTRIEGSFDEAIEGIRNVKSLGQKVRTNTCVCKQNKDTLSEITDLAMELGVDHINISNIHTTGKAYKNFHEIVPKVTECISDVKKAVDNVVNKGGVITLEGYTACMLDDYRKYMIDWNEINYKLLFRKIVLSNYDEFMNNETRKQGKPCKECIENTTCGGIYKEYAGIYGWDEFSPIEGEEGSVIA